MKLPVKWGKLTFQYFQKGEYVRTPNGVGQVAKDEADIKFPSDLYHSIKVQHKFGWSDNPNNEVVPVERRNLSRIELREYEKEEE